MNILMTAGSTTIEFYNYFLSIYLSYYDMLIYILYIYICCSLFKFNVHVFFGWKYF